MFISKSAFEALNSQVFKLTELLKEKENHHPLRKFTLIFEKRKPVEVTGHGVAHGENGGFSIKKYVNGEERTAHWFSEQPKEWFSTWL